MTDKGTGFTEAPASATARLISPQGVEWLLTCRDEQVSELIKKVDFLEAHLLEHGWTSPGGRAAAPAPAGGSDTPEGVESFAAEQLVATIRDGKAYWKVKGPPFAKYGVMVWPEVLEEAGFNVEELDPMKPVSLAGHTAHFIREDGNPKKVIKLA